MRAINVNPPASARVSVPNSKLETRNPKLLLPSRRPFAGKLRKPRPAGAF